jgi:hypothetical protein
MNRPEPAGPPVALLIFNRPGTTARVFEAVRKVRPRRMLVVADGPRPEVAGETELCTRARHITEDVDWPCEVSRAYSDVNLGCKRRISSGVDWVFEHVSEAIFLEDDCLPSPSFFPYCAELLARYRDEERVMHIGGSNLNFGRRDRYSYFFSRYPHIWGWASWRRSWAGYDPDLREWCEAGDKAAFLEPFTEEPERAYWRRVWDESASGRLDTWDFQWAFACIQAGGLSINPNANLVSNLGYAEGATHTETANDELADIPASSLETPLRHPDRIERDQAADAVTARRFFSDRPPEPPPAEQGLRAKMTTWLSRSG